MANGTYDSVIARVGVVVDGRLGLLSGWRPSHGPRLLDLRFVRSEMPLASIWSSLGLSESDWVLVPSSRAWEVPQTIGRLIVWRSPLCPIDATANLLDRRSAGVLVTSKRDLEGVSNRVDCVLLSGWESAGVVGEESALVTLRQVLRQTGAEVWMLGGLGPDAAAGAIAAGATGVFLSDVLWATPEADASMSLLQLLERFDPSDSDALGRHFDFSVRVFRQLATRPPQRFEELELARLQEPQERAAAACWQQLLAMMSEREVNVASTLLPIGQSGALACALRDRFGHAQAIVEHYTSVIDTSLSGIARDYPLAQGGRFAQRFGTRFPLSQGPMSQVADVPEFIDAMERAGALPWVALSNMPDYVAEPLLALVRERMGSRPWGVNIIGMDSNRYRDSHIHLLLRNPPPYVMVGAGTVEQALRLESHGIRTFLHTPVPALLRAGLRGGLRRFVLEGGEAGGHVGRLSSASLVGYAVEALLEESRNGVDLDEVAIVVAGGYSDRRAAHFAAAMLYRLHALGVAVAVQMGTAYLMTDEALASGAVSAVFQQMALERGTTTLMGRTVNTLTRVLTSPAAATIVAGEDERLKAGDSLKKRKHHYEDDNFGGLRAAAKAERIEFTDETRRHVRLVPIAADEQRRIGLFHAGQTVALLDRVRPALELNLEMASGPACEPKGVSAWTDGASGPALGRHTSRVNSMRSTKERDGRGDIAIIGVAAKVADALTVDAFWRNILAGHSAITEVPPEVWDPAFYWDPDRSAPDKTYSKIGAFVRGFEFDRKQFRIPPAVVRSIDPAQQLALATTAEALDDAGLLERDFDRSRCAVILGNALGGDQHELTTARIRFPMFANALLAAARDEAIAPELVERLLANTEARFKAVLPPVTEDTMPGELANVVAGRIANTFDLRGPNFITDAACASSMAAIDAAVRGLRAGAFDLAVTGGADRCMSPATYTKFAKVGALSPDGSRPFDAGANGFVMGEGAAILVIKRLADAERDGDRIYALIRGIGGGSDGRGKGITAPNPDGQLGALRAAYGDAGVAPQSLGLLEAHGTSTRVGDVAEATSFSRLFENERAPRPVRIGSVKSNIGHLKAAAGAAGVLKAALALHHRVLPPTANVEEPNPRIDFEAAPLRVQRQAEPWEAEGVPRRAGVSSFGFGGTNFHIVLEEYDPNPPSQSRRSAESDGDLGAARSSATAVASAPSTAWLDGLGVSAESRETLGAELDRAIGELKRVGERAELLQRGFDEPAGGPFRLAIAGDRVDDLLDLAERARAALRDERSFRVLENQGVFLRGPDDDLGGAIAFLFPGQGSQYLQMGADLHQRFPSVAAAFQRSDELLAGQLPRPLSEYVLADPQSAEAFEALSQTDVTQPAVLTLDLALLEILSDLGVKADVVAGHSLGEYGACVAAGVLSAEDAIRTVAVRGTAMAHAQPLEGDRGLMASVPLDASDVEPELARFGGRVLIANKNSPKQTIIAGYTEAMETAMAWFSSQGVRTVLLPVSHAFHTPIVSPATPPLRQFLDSLTISAPRTPIFTNVDASLYPDEPDAIRDTLSVQLARPVEWSTIIERMVARGVRTFIEVGPKRALTGFVSDTLGDRPHRAYISNHPKTGGPASMARLLGGLWADGLLHSTHRPARPERASAASSTAPDNGHVVASAAGNGSLAGMFGWAAHVLQTGPPEADSNGALQQSGQDVWSAVPERAQAYEVLLRELCERTGYDPAEIEPDFELEADLGVDTVKQAEILSAVREHFALPRDDEFRLADHPTLADLTDYLVAHAGAAQAADDDGVAVMAAPIGPPEEPTRELPTRSTAEPNRPAPGASADAASTGLLSWASRAAEAASPKTSPRRPSSLGPDQAYAALLEELCERTGYDPAEIEPDFELEADLGVDTVKQAEILSAVRDRFELPRDEEFRLADYPTLAELADYLAGHVGDHRLVEPKEAAIGATAAASGQDTEPSTPAPGVSHTEAYETLLAELCERTGYDPAEIEPDFELEADLGVDTVKQAEILSAVRERFKLPSDDEFRLAEHPTLAELARYIAEHSSARNPANTLATPPSPVEPSKAVTEINHPTGPGALADRQPRETVGSAGLDFGMFGPTQVVPLETEPVQLDRTQLEALLADRKVALVDVEPSLASALEVTLGSFGAHAVRLSALGSSETELTAAFAGPAAPHAVVAALGAATGDPVAAGLALFRLARAITRSVAEADLSSLLWLSLTRSGGRLALDGSGGATTGVVAGMTKALSREWASPTVRLLDLADEPTTQAYALSLLTQAWLGEEIEAGWAYGSRVVAVERPAKGGDPVELGPEDTLLITGGARGITAHVARAVAERWGCRLILMGRTELLNDTSIDLAAEKARARDLLARSHDRVTPAMVREALRPIERSIEVRDTLNALRERGVSVQYVAADVTSAESVAAAVANLTARGRIDGVIHGAGIEVSRALVDKDEASVERVLATKVAGATNLLSALSRQPLRLVVGFGSVVGRYGNAGQLDYAGANAGLAALLHHVGRARPGMAALTIDWTAWADVGMAVDSGAGALMAANGVDLLPLDRGAQFAVDLMAAGARGEVVVAAGLGSWRQAGRPEASIELASPPSTLPASLALAAEEPLATPFVGLLETVDVADDGASAEAGVLLEAEEPYLNDHRIDGRPVLPAVMAVEMCAQLGQRLAGGAPYRGLQDFRFERPVKLHRDEPLQLLLNARRLGDDADGTRLIKVSVRTVRRARTGRSLESDHFEGILRFGGPAAQPAPLRTTTVGAIQRGADRTAIYSRLFHTGTFAVLDELVAFGAEMAVAEGRIGHEPLSTLDNRFLTEPLVTEMAFQAGGLFGLAHFGAMSLPAGIERASLLAATRPGQHLTTRVAIRRRTEERLWLDAQVIDDRAAVVADLVGVELIVAAVDERLRLPERGPLDVWVEHLNHRDLPEAAFASPSALANADEIEAYERKRSARARREWVTSRTLVKRMVADFYRRFEGVRLTPQDVSIVKDEHGAPTLAIRRATETHSPTVSISHSEGRVMVSLVPPWRSAAAGVDLERVTARSDRFARDFFSERERAVADGHGARDSMLTAMWSLKEAASKALGLGTHLDLRKEIEVTRIGRDDAVIRFDGRAQQRLEDMGMSFSRALWSLEDGYAAARVELKGRT